MELDLTNLAVVYPKGASSVVNLILAPGDQSTVVCRVVRPGDGYGIGFTHADLTLT